MPLTLPAVSADALLVTPEELQAAALSSLALDVSGGAGTDDYDQTALALQDAQARVESYLERTLLVHAATQDVAVGAWRSLPYGDPRRDLDLDATAETAYAAYATYARSWPVVEITSPTTLVQITDEPGAPARRILATATTARTLAYFAGYRGRQHTLDGAGDTTALVDLDGLAALTVLPPLVPADIRRTIEELALLYMNQARNGTLGTGARIQQTGSSSNVIEAADMNAETRTLYRIAYYRYVHV